MMSLLLQIHHVENGIYHLLKLLSHLNSPLFLLTTYFFFILDSQCSGVGEGNPSLQSLLILCCKYCHCAFQMVATLVLQWWD